MRIVVLCLLLVTGCVVHRRTVMPVDLARESKAFVDTGKATVLAKEGMVEVSADELVFVHLREDGGTERPVELTVRALVEGCVDGLDAAGCKAGRASDDQPALDKKRYEFSGSKLATTLTFAAIGGGVGYCVAECAGSGGLESGAKYVGIGAAVVVGSFLLFALAGG
jgi:hypothetical protein